MSLNQIFAALGMLDWKPALAALLLPPAPFLLLILLAWALHRRRPKVAAVVLALSLLALWLSHCEAIGLALERQLSVAPPLSPARLIELRASISGRKSVVLVLGGGVQPLAAEYGEAHLTDQSLQRLHYGLWLSRQLHAPLMVSGGAGRSQPIQPAEAEVAARIAQRDYGRSLRWIESVSGDTRDNARLSLALLAPQQVTDLVLVTHGWHMRRALRAFEQQAARTGYRVRVVPAPISMSAEIGDQLLRWLPSTTGYQRVHQSLHEMLGLLAGA